MSAETAAHLHGAHGTRAETEQGQRTQRNTPQGTKEPLIDRKPQTPIENGARTTDAAEQPQPKSNPRHSGTAENRTQAPAEQKPPYSNLFLFQSFPNKQKMPRLEINTIHKGRFEWWQGEQMLGL